MCSNRLRNHLVVLWKKFNIYLFTCVHEIAGKMKYTFYVLCTIHTFYNEKLATDCGNVVSELEPYTPCSRLCVLVRWVVRFLISGFQASISLISLIKHTTPLQNKLEKLFSRKVVFIFLFSRLQIVLPRKSHSICGRTECKISSKNTFPEISQGSKVRNTTSSIDT